MKGGIFIPRKTYDCNNYGDVSVKEVTLYCLDCEDYTIQQLTFYKGNKNDKVQFCMQCGKHIHMIGRKLSNNKSIKRRDYL